MRRVWATLVLVLFSFSLIGPLVSANVQSGVPACCRRAGKHHCAMAGDASASHADSQGAALRASRDQCPFYLMGRAIAPETRSAPVVSAFLLFVFLVASGPVWQGREAADHHRFNFSLPQRGPPVLSC